MRKEKRLLCRSVKYGYPSKPHQKTGGVFMRKQKYEQLRERIGSAIEDLESFRGADPEIVEQACDLALRLIKILHDALLETETVMTR